MPPQGSPAARHKCPHCESFFTASFLPEHIRSAHLGRRCHFPGSSLVLDADNATAMTEELMRANQQHGGGYRDGEFWCHWPNCRGEQPHAYKNERNLRRHLQTTQGNRYREGLRRDQAAQVAQVVHAAQADQVVQAAQDSQVVHAVQDSQAATVASTPDPSPHPAPTANFVLESGFSYEDLINAVTELRLARARRGAKIEILGILIRELRPAGPATLARGEVLCQHIEDATAALNTAVENIQRIVGNGPDGYLITCWNSYRALSDHARLGARVYLSDFKVDVAFANNWARYQDRIDEVESVLDQMNGVFNKVPTGLVYPPFWLRSP
ncbi:hypothetical protein F5Y11DRAFT_362107 [Daldinia sp. FL1419]|nr:hypothetical protein F5Y11DRAFT_362107 [Daldinia sp. FL1419]